MIQADLAVLACHWVRMATGQLASDMTRSFYKKRVLGFTNGQHDSYSCVSGDVRDGSRAF